MESQQREAHLRYTNSSLPSYPPTHPTPLPPWGEPNLQQLTALVPWSHNGRTVPSIASLVQFRGAVPALQPLPSIHAHGGGGGGAVQLGWTTALVSLSRPPRDPVPPGFCEKGDGQLSHSRLRGTRKCKALIPENSHRCVHLTGTLSLHGTPPPSCPPRGMRAYTYRHGGISLSSAPRRGTGIVSSLDGCETRQPGGVPSRAGEVRAHWPWVTTFGASRDPTQPNPTPPPSSCRRRPALFRVRGAAAPSPTLLPHGVPPTPAPATLHIHSFH